MEPEDQRGSTDPQVRLELEGIPAPLAPRRAVAKTRKVDSADLTTSVPGAARPSTGESDRSS